MNTNKLTKTNSLTGEHLSPQTPSSHGGVMVTPKVKADLPLGDRNSQLILPRSSWQDKKAWLKAVIRAKRALDLAEINFLLEGTSCGVNES